VVLEAERGKGFGSALVRAAIDDATAQGVIRVWVLTTTAVEFLRRLGFHRVERSAAPPAITATTEFASLCPATAVCMTRTSA
jgi:N-acetylglutamate synthase-like GNAT family acetyltransferase